jgi:iron-sulfur cluster assembly accessory protein
MSIEITPAAEKFIRRMIRFGGGPDCGFRLVVCSGGCSGLAAEFSVEASPRPGDSVFQKNGINFFLPAESRLLLDGVTIDFVDTPNETGFVFHDPKAGACGCGSSGSTANKAQAH